jgi:hypothetical protein
MTDLSKLKRLAEAFQNAQATGSDYWSLWQQYREATQPPETLFLISRVEKAEARVKELEGALRNRPARNAPVWDNDDYRTALGDTNEP